MNNITNLSNYRNNKINNKLKDDELVEIDFNSFVKNLESGKYENIKELLKDYKNN